MLSVTRVLFYGRFSLSYLPLARVAVRADGHIADQMAAGSSFFSASGKKDEQVDASEVAPIIVTNLSHLGILLSGTGKVEDEAESESVFLRAAVISARVLGQHHLNTATVHITHMEW